MPFSLAALMTSISSSWPRGRRGLVSPGECEVEVEVEVGHPVRHYVHPERGEGVFQVHLEPRHLTGQPAQGSCQSCPGSVRAHVLLWRGPSRVSLYGHLGF